MPSPFPGMDPYLEKHWRDVHASLIVYARDQLQPRRLPNGLRASTDERVLVDVPSAERPIYPDVRVVEFKRSKGPRKSSANGSTATLAEPLIIETGEPPAETFIEIRDVVSGNKLVTVIEVLSPSNKYGGEPRDKYIEKREELRKGGISLVEIDLLRAGPRPFPFPGDMLRPEYCTAYHAWVRRGWAPDKTELYRIPLDKTVPIIHIPLRPKDKDVPLDLQALIDKCYLNGGYATIDYSRDPDPPLSADDSKWIDAVLRKAGLRKSRRSKRK
jgi:hypothetical protein